MVTDTAPWELEKVPAVQLVQILDPAAEKVPAWQLMHWEELVADKVVENLPASQFKQAPAPTAE